MGSESSKSEAEKEKSFNELVKQFGELQKANHPFFGAIKRGMSKESQENFVIIKEIWFQSEKDALKYKELVQARQVDHPFLMKPSESFAVTEKTMCSTIVRCKFATKVPELTLSEVITKKRKKFQGGTPVDMPPQLDDVDEYFSEPEIWYILDGLVGMAKQFKNIGFSHGFIHPATIYADSDGHLSLPDVMLFLNPNESYSLSKVRVDILEYERLKAAVAPEILELIKTQKQGKFDVDKTEVWSIALTILCICVNADIGEFYDWSQKRVKHNTIDTYFDKMIEIGYSKDLVSVLAKAVEKSPANRTSLDDLHQYLIELDTQMQESEKALENSGEFPKASQFGGKSNFMSYDVAPGASHVPFKAMDVQESQFIGGISTVGGGLGGVSGYQANYNYPAPLSNYSGVNVNASGLRPNPYTSATKMEMELNSSSYIPNQSSYAPAPGFNSSSIGNGASSQFVSPSFNAPKTSYAGHPQLGNVSGVSGAYDYKLGIGASSVLNEPSFHGQSSYIQPPVPSNSSGVYPQGVASSQVHYSGATAPFMSVKPPLTFGDAHGCLDEFHQIGGGDWMTRNIGDSRHY